MRRIRTEYFCDICGRKCCDDREESKTKNEDVFGSGMWNSSDSIYTYRARKAEEKPMIDIGDSFVNAFMYALLSGADCCRVCRDALLKGAEETKQRIAELRK